MNKFFLVIDQGTTSSRIVLYNKNFEIFDIVQKEFKQFFPNEGWVEHNATEIWNDVKKLISKILNKNRLVAKSIISIGITNQRETTVLWNKKTGKPIYRAIVWQDRRTASFCEKLKKKGMQKKIQKITGLEVDPYFSASKITWIIDNIKEAKRNLKNDNLLFGTIDTWLLWNLTKGESHLTDISNASRTMIFDSQKEKWSDEILKILRIPKKILPNVVENTYDFGSTKLFGDSIPIGGMAGDQQSATIGQACFKKGQSKSTYGTGCFLLMNIGERFKLSKNRLLTTVAFKINGKKMFCYEGSIFVAGSAIQWLRDNLKFIKDSSETDKLYKKANKDENLYFVPALTGLGAPYWNPNARGTLFGITRNTSKEDIIKATLDSLSFQTYELIESMEKDSRTKISEIRVDGGMVKNNNFLKSLANVSQINIIRPKNIETTSLGAAYLAAIQSGYLNSTNQISKLWKKDKTVKAKVSKSISKSNIRKWKLIINAVNNFYKDKNFNQFESSKE
ncbi:glycerol kinase GlpK [bacterium]|nr:glycerol kinase GlpK [bacterium]